jgi:pimeloyl-ACP methyl ester carboxylesterase
MDERFGPEPVLRRSFLKVGAAGTVLAALAARAGAHAMQAPQPTASNIFVRHALDEHQIDLGEVVMNYATLGSPSAPALLLMPPQTRSWWNFEAAMKLLAPDFQVFAIDLRGQGRSSRTPGRYTLDNMGNDLVRFVNRVVKRPVITSGCSSGGLLSAWMSAYAPPGVVRGALYEDPPLFASELTPPFGPGIRQTVAGQSLGLMARYLGDQWSVGDWGGFQRASSAGGATSGPPASSEPPQNFKEYDPEWARSFYEGAASRNCDHQQMLRHVKVPVLLTHHRRSIDPRTGMLSGALSDFQAQKIRELVEGAGQKCDYVSLPDAAHAMHNADPERFVRVLRPWAMKLSA